MSTVAAPRPIPSGERDDEYAPRHVYRPHRTGLPPMRSYLQQLWRRREFAVEMVRTNLRTQHFQSVLGLAWLVLNPVMQALIYFVLVNILRDGTRGSVFFAHLVAGIFAFHFVSQSVSRGAKSVVGGGRLILNTAFPRTLLPISSVMTSFVRFLPTLAVYAVVHVAAGLPIGLHLLWILPLMLILVLFATGVAMLVAAAQVYFRDIKDFLPHLMRLWLYASPVLYYLDEVPDGFRPFIDANPLTPMLSAWSDVLNAGDAPSLGILAWSAGWAILALVGGGLFFISREREFAVRL
ncbi:MAG TPA: ABC transporter permease [Solirubrobacteraceae bacterium]|jgi:teichoic acid transport system permease protein